MKMTLKVNNGVLIVAKNKKSLWALKKLIKDDNYAIADGILYRLKSPLGEFASYFDIVSGDVVTKDLEFLKIEEILVTHDGPGRAWPWYANYTSFKKEVKSVHSIIPVKVYGFKKNDLVISAW